MSTVCRVSSRSDKVSSGVYCLTKGSPEVIGSLLASKPEWYDATYTHMAEKGQRILALAYRKLGSEGGAAREYCNKSRDEVECNMCFAGFIAFKCETRKDSMLVCKALNDSKHYCVMLTGDAPLTAYSVAQEVGISQYAPAQALLLTCSEGSNGDAGSLVWLPALTQSVAADAVAKAAEPLPFDPSKLDKLAECHDLVVTGRCLEMAMQREDVEVVKSKLHLIRIYARLSPWQKEQIIRTVRTGQNVFTLMCGDGGNDVGALKEADVGLALLSGFGNANVGGEELALVAGKVENAEEALDVQRKEHVQHAQAISKKANEELARKRKDLMSRQQQWIQEEIEARRQRGEDTGFMGQMAAMKVVMSRLQSEIKKEQELMQKKHGNGFAAGAAKAAVQDLDGMEDIPMVKLGDASTAAPFTSRTPSISSCIDIIRQGRCTLLSAVQQMEIMMLESMISAYTMSAMTVDGTRPSEAQMMASGTLMSVASLAFSFARPVDRMHPVRPLASVFHPAILFSMLGQLAIHLGCMIYIARLAKDIMGEDLIQEVREFEKDRNKKIDSMDEEAFNDWAWFMSVPFKNNLLNTCCWLVETAQQISVIFVNYKGRPWMKGMLENQPLFLSLFLCIAMVAVCAWGAIPYLNQMLNLEVVPEDLRFQVMGTLLVSVVGTFLWDRLMVAIFAPHIFNVLVSEAKATTFADVLPILKTVGYIIGGGFVLLAGNPLLWGVAYLIYRKTNTPTPAEGAAPARPA